MSRTSRLSQSDAKAPGAFRTISEVAKELDVQQHVLRFWETKFSQVSPLTRGGGRRYYRPEDVAVLKKVHEILYKEGYTIKGAQNLFKGLSKNQLSQLQLKRPALEQENSAAISRTDQATSPSSRSSKFEGSGDSSLGREKRQLLESALDDLKALKSTLKSL